MTHRKSLLRSRWLAAGIACLVVTGVAVAAAAGAVATKSAPTLNVLVDQTRATEIQAYLARHPGLNVKVNVITTDPLTEIRLALKAKSNIPDVLFDSGPTTYAGNEFQIYAGDLSKYIPPKVVKQFVPTSNTSCYLGGKLLCLRNDLAQDVLWVNTKLFQQFGYKVPQTWQQFEAVGLKLAQQHPGYSIGATQGWNAFMDMYYGGFQCPFNQVLNAKTIRINMHAVGCQHLYSTLDPLLKAGVLGGSVGFFDTAAQLGAADKFLMMIGPSWWGDHILEPFYNAPKGEWTANQPPSWGNGPRVTGSGGGGVWMMYRNTPNPKAAAAFIQAMTTDVPGAATKPTYPAYGPAVPVYSAHVATDPFYSRNPVPAMNLAAGELTSTLSFARFDYTPVYDTIIAPAMKNGQSLASVANAAQAALTKLAKQAGYKVVVN
ncbi:MAG TPA: extracellular solute-binding protein [Gaiellaceae bacterium]|nr:extracellular solute-binding protein [Gaiellaceae bacterium]